MVKKGVSKAYSQTKSGTGKVVRFISKEGNKYFRSAKKTLGLSAKKNKR